MAVINNTKSNTLLSGTSGDDTIRNGGYWDDSWHNGGSNVSINSGAGNDYVLNYYGSNVTINTGEGNDEVDNSGSSVTINTGAGNDSVGNYGSEVTINTGAGNDSVNNNADSDKVTINTGAGNDYVENYSSSVSINTGAGNDSVFNWSDSVTINTGEGNDYVYNGYDSVTINAGAGDDSIVNIGSNVLFNYNLGDGSDTISSFNSTSTLIIGGGSGTYSTTKSGNDFLITVGEGTIVLKNAYATADSIQINSETIELERKSIELADGGDSIENLRDSLAINGGAGDDYIYNNGSSVTINGDEGNDTITSRKRNSYYGTLSSGIWDVAVNAGAGDDYISLNGGNNKIFYNAGDGNDTISGATENDTINIFGSTYTRSTIKNDVILTVGNGSIRLKDASNTNFKVTTNASDNPGTLETALNVTNNISNKLITGTALDDTIYNSGDNVTINALGGDDSIQNGGWLYENGVWTWHDGGSNVTINAGAGNDSVSNGGSSVTINAGAGNDSVSNLVSSVTINTGADNDSIDNLGSSVTINTGEGNDEVYNDASSVTINTGEGNDSVWNSSDATLTSINTGAGNDSVYNYGSSVTINTGAGNDYVYNSGSEVTINTGEGNDSVENFDCSSVTINTGEGNDSVKNYGSSVTITGGKGNDSIYNNCYRQSDGSIYYSENDGGENVLFKYDSGDGNDTIWGFNENSTLSIGGGSYSSQKSGDDIIFTVGTGKISLMGAASLSNINIEGDEIPTDPTTLTITNSTKSPVTVDSAVKTIDASTRRRPIRITGNALDNSITGGKGKDTIYGGAGNDTLTDTNGKNIFIYDSGNDIITDFNEKKDSISLSADYQSYALNGDDLILNFGNNNFLTIKDGAGKKITSVQNRKKADNIFMSSGILGDKKKSMTLLPTVTNFDATSAKDYSKVVTIDGSAAESEISITGNRKKNYITAGANDSTLSGGKGNDTLVGGDGQDVFLYNNGDGKDIVENYDAGDRINLNGATIKDAMIKNNSGVIKIGSGSLTVKDTSEFILADGNSETIVSDGVFIAEGVAKVYSSFKGTIDLSESEFLTTDGSVYTKTADASLAKKATTINGGTLADSIVGGKGSDKLYGNEGADILIGGKGNDSLWGDDDNDTFIYNAGTGNDFIMDYAEGDMLRILDKQGNEGSFSKATFGNESLTLNIQGGGKVIFKNVSETTAFNINGESYHVEGKTLAQ